MERNRIYNMDCVEGLRKLPDNSVDLIVTSPPYDDLRSYKGYDWDFEDTAKECHRVLKKGGVMVWVTGDSTRNGCESLTSFRQALFFKGIGFAVDTMIYEKTGYFPTTAKRYDNVFEYIFVLVKGGGQPSVFNPIMKRNNCYGTKAQAKHRDKNGDIIFRGRKQIREFNKRTNIWKYNTGFNAASDKIAFRHPAVFPEKLAEDIVRSWSDEGDLVLDPFMGSGTTALAAKRLGRDYIGFEISAEYCDLAEERLSRDKLLVSI